MEDNYPILGNENWYIILINSELYIINTLIPSTYLFLDVI